MAKKVLLKDENSVEILPITRGELILDSSGKQALHSDEFLATTSQPGLLSAADKIKIENMQAASVANALTLKINNGSTEGTDLYTYDGSTAKILQLIEGSNISFTTSSGKVNVSATVPTKLSQLTDDVVAGKYLPLSGGWMDGAFGAHAYQGTKPIGLGDKVDGFTIGDRSFGLTYWSTNMGYGNLQQMRFDGTPTAYTLCLQPLGGGVAIGGTTANEKLHIYGNAIADAFYGRLVGNADSANSLVNSDKNLVVHISDGHLYVGDHIYNASKDVNILGNNIYLRYGTKAARGFTLNSNGNVTIGSGDFASVYKLYVEGSSYVDGNIYGKIANLKTIELTDAAPYIDFHYGNSTTDFTSRIVEDIAGRINLNDVLFVNKDGNASINGTLHITRSNGLTYSQGIRINTIDEISSVWFNTTSDNGYDEGMWGITAMSGGNLRFRGGTTSLSDLMVITQNGNIGVGVTSPTDKLEVNGNIKATKFIGDVSGNATSATNTEKLNGKLLGLGLNHYWDVVPYITAAGVLEAGLCIDFHRSDNDTLDYGTRLICDGNHKNEVRLPSSSGTLALTSDIPTSLPASGGTADKLSIARYIWGQSFDGTNNIENASLVLWQTPSSTYTGGWARQVYAASSDGKGIGAFGFQGDGNNLNYIYIGKAYNDRWITIDSNGNTGIGVNSPSAKLDVNGNANIAGALKQVVAIHSHISSGGTYNNWRIVPYNGELLFQVASNDGLSKAGKLRIEGFEGTGLEKLYIGANNVGIGTSSPSERLDVNGNIKAVKFLGNIDGSYINALTNYNKATVITAITDTDSLNTALGKLEYKADTAYKFIEAANDNDGTIENLREILDVLTGISDTDTIKEIIGKYLPLTGGTIDGSLTIGNEQNTTYKYIRFNRYGHYGIINNLEDGVYISFGDIENGVSSVKKILRIGNAGIQYSYDGSTSNFQHILHQGNFSDYALPLSGGTLTGNLTAPKFIGVLQGNADSAYKLLSNDKAFAQVVGNNVLFGWELAPEGYDTLIAGRSIQFRHGLDKALAMDISNAGDVNIHNKLSVNGVISGNLDGNASSATKATQDSDGNAINTTYVKNWVNLNGKDLNDYKTTGFYNGYNLTSGPDPNKGISTVIVNKYSGDWGSQIYHAISANKLFVRTWKESGGIMDSSWKQIAYTDSSITGNADTATKLATSRKIWGQEFDGTKDISGNLTSNIWRIAVDPSYDGTFIQSMNYDATSNNGTIIVSGWNGSSLQSFGVWAAKCYFNGNVGFGATNPSEKIEVNGNVKATKFIGDVSGKSSTTDALNIGGIGSETLITETGVRAYAGNGVNWSGDVSSMAYAAVLSFGTPSRGWQLWASREGVNNKKLSGFHFRTGKNDQTGWGDEHVLLDSYNFDSYAPKLDGTGATGTWNINIGGNAATTTKLQTARTIWGQSFDGSGNIEGDFIAKDADGWALKRGTQNILRIANAGLVITPYDKENGFIALRTGTETVTNGSKEIRIISSGNVGIGVSNPEAKLHINGSILINNLTNALDQSITFRTGSASEHGTYDYRIGKFDGGFGLAMNTSDGSWNKFLKITTNGTYGVDSVDITTTLNVQGYVYTAGVVKTDSSNSYLLLGGGSHKAVSDFVLASDFTTKELTSNLTTITKTLTVAKDWMDTGISGTDLETGTYIVQVYVDNTSSNIWKCYWSGVMTWYAENTDDSDTDEIILHRSGHHYDRTIYLRTVMQYKSYLKLQIAASNTISSTSYTFKFKKLI